MRQWRVLGAATLQQGQLRPGAVPFFHFPFIPFALIVLSSGAQPVVGGFPGMYTQVGVCKKLGDSYDIYYIFRKAKITS